jgi:toxin ParE1/3/4
MRLVWSEDARNDLIAIRHYIAERHPRAARQVAARLRSAARRLVAMRDSGRPGRWPGTREFVVAGTAFLMPYRIEAGTIEILRVLHGA